MATDRLLIRGIVAVAVLVSAFADTGEQPVWAAVIGWIAVSVVVVLLLRSVVRDKNAQSWSTKVSTLHAIAMMVAAVVAAFAFHGSATVWLPYIGVAAAAMSETSILASTLIALPSLTALGVLMWWQTHNAWAVCINVASAAAVFVFVQLRRRQRDAAELAATQREIIAAQQSRAALAQQQRQISAQLHDVLAHTLSGLIITLQGAALQAERESASAELTEKLRTATALARDGLSEAKTAVESLRDNAVRESDPLDQWLPKTLAQLRTGAGLDVEVSGDVDDVPALWHDDARRTHGGAHQLDASRRRRTHSYRVHAATRSGALGRRPVDFRRPWSHQRRERADGVGRTNHGGRRITGIRYDRTGFRSDGPVWFVTAGR